MRASKLYVPLFALLGLSIGCSSTRTWTNDVADATMDAAAAAIDSSTGGTGGAGGSGGIAGNVQPPVNRPCIDPDDDEREPIQTRATTVGADDTLTDSCDADGNLVERTCQRLELPNSACGCAGECGPCTHQTGRVVSTTHDCNGHCVDGACPSWCPAVGDALTITADEDAGTLDVENHTQERRYSCSVHPDEHTLCRDLSRYVSTQSHEYATTCYGAEPAVVSLPWQSPDGSYGCAVRCTEIEEP